MHNQHKKKTESSKKEGKCENYFLPSGACNRLKYLLVIVSVQSREQLGGWQFGGASVSVCRLSRKPETLTAELSNEYQPVLAHCSPVESCCIY